MKKQLEKYIRAELKTLKYKGDIVRLENVYPSILEDIVGDFTPYDLNGYDCDYWASTDKYDIFGCMRFGTAKITLKVGKEKPVEKEIEAKTEESQEPVILRKEDVSEEVLSGLCTTYFTFGCGQLHDGYYQPIMAKDSSVAHKKMIEVYGTAWAFMYDEERWKESSKYYSVDKGLEPIIAL